MTYPLVEVDLLRKGLELRDIILVVALYCRFAGNCVEHIVQHMRLWIMAVHTEIVCYLGDDILHIQLHYEGGNSRCNNAGLLGEIKGEAQVCKELLICFKGAELVTCEEHSHSCEELLAVLLAVAAFKALEDYALMSGMLVYHYHGVVANLGNDIKPECLADNANLRLFRPCLR